MHLRDDRAYQYIAQNISSHRRISHDEIAEYLGCHRVTVCRITKRLSLAGLIVVVDPAAKRGGYIYRLTNAS